MGIVAFFGKGAAATALSVTASPNPATGTVVIADGPTTTTVYSETCTATASGGTPGYTYSWTRISGSAAITATNPSSASTAFTGTIFAGTTTAVFRVTVTDAASNTATFDVTVELTYDR